MTQLTATARRTTLVRPWVPLLIGAGGAVAGLLSWLITGARLPLQNVWENNATPAQMPIALLPFSQYAIALLVGVIVTGPAVSGLVLRALRPRLPRRSVPLAIAGVAVVQVLAAIQTAVVASTGLREDPRATLYFAALVGGTAVTIVIGIATLALFAIAPPAGVIIGAAVAGIAASSWLAGLIVPFGSVSMPLYPLLSVVRWVPAVAVGVAIGWWGIATIGRVCASVAAFGVLWLAPGVQTGVGNAVGSRVLTSDLRQMLDYGLNVTGMALTSVEIVLPPLVVAAAVAVIVGAGRKLWQRRRPSKD